MPVSGDDTDSEFRQQSESVHQSVTVTGPHEPERLGETEVHLRYNMFYTAIDLLARLQAVSALI